MDGSVDLNVSVDEDQRRLSGGAMPAITDHQEAGAESLRLMAFDSADFWQTFLRTTSILALVE
ncbi:hypothetical protein KIN20_017500 [Parelaphostrongylus tenuis]|uniref:Uncharacterized protein n=1 Tax=Parelaphostrongylus tenuis TaxID=148309 RepID=A0AAD5QTU7_PARTN|nr:hypothetical protein KIN20_017500 [Parelaphostrongylus tenuis]